MRCVAGAEAADEAVVKSSSNEQNGGAAGEKDAEKLHLTGRSRARTLTRTYSNLSQSMRQVSYAELDEKKTGINFFNINF